MNDNKPFRLSINSIPKDQSKLRSSALPLFFSVDFQHDQVPILREPLIRCEKCKGYLNPYVEIISPGYKWRCNLCETVNEVSIPFQMRERGVCDHPGDPIANSSFNRRTYQRGDLENDTYELEAPDSFNVTTPDQPVLCFVVEVSGEAMRQGILGSVMNAVREALKVCDWDARTKVAIFFFDEAVHVLTTGGTLAVINGEVPLLLAERMLFPLGGDEWFEKVALLERHFAQRGSRYANYLLALQACARVFRSATLLCFVSTAPNFGEGAINPDNSFSLTCKNPAYKMVAESLVKKSVTCNLFVMTRGSVELGSIKLPSQYTGGQIFHYPNYEGGDPSSTAKFFCDLSDYLARESNTGAVCRIRANEGVLLKSVYGHFFQKGSDLLSYANFSPAHCINFTLQLYNELKGALYVQIAMARVVKDGNKLIRVMNICVPIGEMSLYEGCDPKGIIHYLALEAFYYESKKKGKGKEWIEGQIIEILKETHKNMNSSSMGSSAMGSSAMIFRNTNSYPSLLNELTVYASALMKGIPLRPDSFTPPDFRGFHMYLLSNYPSKAVDLMIYPLLLNVLTENVSPLPLSKESLSNSHGAGGIFLLDTGASLFFYIAPGCDPLQAEGLFEATAPGPFLFVPPENDLSGYVTELVGYLTSGREVKPRFILARGDVASVYNEIFMSYMYEDEMHGLPRMIDYKRGIDEKISGKG